MKKESPRISIIMATYNRAHLIRETLVSIQAQTFTDWECLIIDDGSTDNTLEVITTFLEADSRLKYHKRGTQHKKGLPGSRNQGLELAKGDFFIFFDDDDIIHPENLWICYRILQREGVDFCRYDKKPFTQEPQIGPITEEKEFSLRPVSCRDIEEVVTGRLAFASCSVMWNRKCFNHHRFNESLMYAEEWECYLRILSSGFTGISIDEVLYYNRKHPVSNTGEYRNNDPIRKNSQVQAVELVLKNLKRHQLITPALVKYFIRLGFLLKEYSIIGAVLEHSDSGFAQHLKYRLGYKFHPLLKPIFYLKSKFVLFKWK